MQAHKLYLEVQREKINEDLIMLVGILLSDKDIY
jgi:hypothetical protein